MFQNLGIPSRSYFFPEMQVDAASFADGVILEFKAEFLIELKAPLHNVLPQDHLCMDAIQS